jgi:ATP-dependent DNA helicase DinG
MSSINILIFDTETNGLPKKNNDFSEINMLELGYLIMDDKFNIIRENNDIIKGDFQVPEIITELTGITKEKTDEGICIDIVLNKFLYDIKHVDYILAHNNRFDLGILKEEMRRNNKSYLYQNIIMKKINLDSIQIFKKEILKKNIKNYKLQTIYNYFHQDQDEYVQTHRALDDCYLLQKSLISLLKSDFSLNEYFLNKPLNFGKYKKKNLKFLYKNDFNYFKFFFNKIHNINYVKFLQYL